MTRFICEKWRTYENLRERGFIDAVYVRFWFHQNLAIERLVAHGTVDHRLVWHKKKMLLSCISCVIRDDVNYIITCISLALIKLDKSLYKKKCCFRRRFSSLNSVQHWRMDTWTCILTHSVVSEHARLRVCVFSSSAAFSGFEVKVMVKVVHVKSCLEIKHRLEIH